MLINSLYDIEAFELSNMQLRLRDGLRFVLQENATGISYILSDPVSSQVHEIGLSQHALMSGIDGTRTLGEITEQLSSEMPGAAMSLEQAERTARYLIDHELAYAVQASGARIESTGRLVDGQEQRFAQKRLENSNPLFIKIPLGNPSRWLDKISPRFSWLFSLAGLVCILALIAMAAMQLWQSSDEVFLSLRGIIDPGSVFWLATIFIALKAVHEMGHAVACHRFGGRVSETGLVFILFVPIPYVDVTSAWGFASKRQRMLVSAAGMIIEMAVAAIAAIAWSQSTDPIIRFHSMNVVLMGTLTTLLFNANFLMRFDGYFLLSDAIGIPNLAPSSRGCLTAHARHFLLGSPLNLSAYDQSHRVVLLSYGAAAMLWRVVVSVGLAIVASKLLFGFGVSLAIVSLFIWFGRPCIRFMQSILADDPDAARCRRVLAVRTFPAMAVLVLVLCLVPWPWQPSAPAIVQHRDEQTVRTTTSGYVRQILVQDGQWIESGDVIARLEDSALESELRIAEARLAASGVRLRQELAAGHVASYQSENSLHQSLEKRLVELQQRQHDCEVRAEASGYIVANRIQEQIGLRFSEGQELCRVVDPEKMELLLSVSQRDMKCFRDRIGSQMSFCFGSSAAMLVNLENIDSHAEWQTDLRLTAAGGGNLALRNTDDQVSLVEPRFQAIAKLSPEQSVQLSAGLTGSLRLADHRQSIASHLWQILGSKWESTFQSASQT